MLSIPVAQLIIAYLIPILYVLSPPTVEHHDKLLQIEKPGPEQYEFGKGSVARYPSKSSREYSWNSFRDTYSYLYFVSRIYMLWILLRSYKLEF